MNSKILFTASIPSHLYTFHKPYLKWFKNQGYEVHTATNAKGSLPYVDKEWVIPFERTPMKASNLKAYKSLKKIIDSENYTLINCHTPVASVITRLAAKSARKNGTVVIYTAHGFHFYNNAPLLNWLIYYPIEVLLTRYTDALITINSEDYRRIKKRGYKKIDYFKVPGIGVSKKNFHPVDDQTKTKFRLEKGFPIDKKMLIYAAEFIDRKNHNFIIDAVASSRELFQDVVFLFAGKGELEESLKSKVKQLQLQEIIQFIGFREDIDQIFKLSDIGISSSKQEGLPINVIEGMMCGLPYIASNIRGHNDIIENNVSGFLYAENDYNAFIQAVKRLCVDVKFKKLSINSIERAKLFELSNSLDSITSIYSKYLK